MCNLLHKSCKLHSGSVCVQRGEKGMRTPCTWLPETASPLEASTQEEQSLLRNHHPHRLPHPSAHGCQPATFLSATLKLKVKKQHHRLCSSTAVPAVLLQLWAQCRTLGLLLPLPSHEGTDGGRARPPDQTRVQGTAAGSILHRLPAPCTGCLHSHSAGGQLPTFLQL